MITNKYEHKHKALLALEREKSVIWKQIRDTESIKLERPIFIGYVKTLELRPEYLKRFTDEDIKAEREILQFFGVQTVFCKDKSFTSTSGRGKRKVVTNLKPYIRSRIDPRFSHYWSETKRVKDVEFIAKYTNRIRECNNIFSCNCVDRKIERIGVYTYPPHLKYSRPDRLHEVVKEKYLTHYKPALPELEERLAEIDNKMRNTNGYALLYGRYNYREWNSEYIKVKYGNDNVYCEAI
jgi:hypothetical protein